MSILISQKEKKATRHPRLSLSIMDDVVAESTMLRTRHLQSTPTSLHLDAIPPLTRPLSQVHAYSVRLLSARSATPTSTTPYHSPTSLHPAALRLFAHFNFDPHRLHHAITHIQSTPTFLDIPSRPTTTHSHLTTVPSRAAHDTRLKANRQLCEHATQTLQADLFAANQSLLAKLQTLIKPSLLPSKNASALTPLSAKLSRKRSAHHISLTVDTRYLNTISGIALHGEGHSAPFLLYDAAIAARDAPHFVQTLAVVASVARYAPHARMPSTEMMVWGARVVLEDQFAEGIVGLPAKPRLAAVAAVVPAVTEYVKGLQRKGSIVGADRGGREVSVWARVFYCLRVGHVEAALHVLRDEKGGNEELGKVTRFVEAFLGGRERIRREYGRDRVREGGGVGLAMSGGGVGAMEDGVPMVAGCVMEQQLYEDLEEFYCETAWRSDDCYMRACCVLLMRLELLSSYGTSSTIRNAVSGSTGHPPYPAKVEGERCSLALPDGDMSVLFASVEDYLWLRLWLCRTPVEYKHMPPSSTFSFVYLEHIRENVWSCGSAHFNPNNSNPLLYPFVLVCCGLYEEAVSYLTSHTDEQLMHPGMHLGIALYSLGWIHDDQAFHTLMSRYVNMFSRVFPAEAAIYLLTLRDRHTVRQFLRDLIVGSGEYAILLGSGAADADQEEPGALAGLLSAASASVPSGLSMEDVVSIRVETAMMGAVEAASREEFATAANLYKAANQFAQSVEMNMNALAEVVYKEHSPNRSLAIADARKNTYEMHNGNITGVSDVTRGTLRVLLQMAGFFQDYWVGYYQAAWGALRCIDIVPLTASDVSTCQSVMETIGNKYHLCIRQCLEELVKAAVHIAKFALEHDSVSGLPGKSLIKKADPTSEEGKQRVPDADEIKSLCTFAGWMRLSDSTVNRDLVCTELLLG